MIDIALLVDSGSGGRPPAVVREMADANATSSQRLLGRLRARVSGRRPD